MLDDPAFAACVTRHEELPARAGSYVDFPNSLDPRIVSALKARSIHQLYSHQAEAIGHAMQGRNVCVVTPTASGKTLCYNIPVVSGIIDDPAARALYLFPTKALSQDQLAELQALVASIDIDLKAYTYDGDTPAEARRSVRQAGH